MLLQVHVLSVRFLRSWYRCPTNLAIQAGQYIFFALLIGLPSLAALKAARIKTHPGSVPPWS